MNFLTNLSGAAKKAIIALAIVGSFAVAVTAQKVEQSQGKMYGDPGFRGEPINLNVVNADIRDILSYITDQYGINFVIDKSVKDVPVTVKVTDVPWNVALESVLQAQGLGVQVNGNILRIADTTTLAGEGEFNRARTNNQLDTSPLVTELIRLNYATAGAGATSGTTTAGTSLTSVNGAYGSGVGAGNVTTGGASGGVNPATTGGDGLLPIIKRRLSRRGSIEIDSRTNSLIVTDVPANILAVKQLIAILDQPEPQVEIEARIVVASRNFSRDIGIQLGAMVNGSRGGLGQGGTLPIPPAVGGPPPGGVNTQPNNNLFSNLSNTVIGLTTGRFGTAQISALISAGEQKGQAKVIATPRVTALNNRKAEIKSGSKIPITTVQPGGSLGGGIIATTTYIDVPLRLEITPQITDQGTVILNLVAENSSAATIVGGVPPAINTQSMTTQVIVPDGGTTVVGGVLFDDERENQDRTPGLASVPVIGNLFKRKAVLRNTNEILFFITPRISRPDYTLATQNGVAPRPSTIIQPVPLGNPPSNSTPVVETPTTPIILQAPALARPEANPITPAKPNN